MPFRFLLVMLAGFWEVFSGFFYVVVGVFLCVCGLHLVGSGWFFPLAKIMWKIALF